MADARLKYSAIVAPAAAAAAVPAAWVYAIIGAESGDVRTFQFRDIVEPTWEGKVGEYSWGPMQILESTARDMGFTGAAVDLTAPAVSIPFAVKYVGRLARQFGDFRSVYSAYNSGNPDAWRSSSQVAANVARASTWLKHFQPRALAGMVAAVVVFGAGLMLYQHQQRGAS